MTVPVNIPPAIVAMTAMSQCTVENSLITMSLSGILFFRWGDSGSVVTVLTKNDDG